MPAPRDDSPTRTHAPTPAGGREGESVWRAETARPSLPSVSGRLPVAVVADTAPDAQAELDRLLNRRRQQVFAILAVVYALFVAREVAMAVASDGGSRLQGGLLVFALAVQLTVVAVFRADRPNRTRWLPSAEWLTLLTFWITQGGNQLATLDKPEEIRVLIDRGLVGQVLTANTWLLPWFALIAGYPVMVPNGVRRTFVIVAVTAAMPILVTALAAALNPELSVARTWLMYVQYLLWGLVGVSIAVYGATQAALLRREAFEARKFGQYRLVRKLGTQGGMGEVFLAEHQLLRRPSVIKLIRADRRHDPRTVSRFEREVRMLATLTHWNTVEVYDYGHTPDGTFYFVMEYLPGHDLQRMVDAHGPLPPERAIHLLAQVCQGLREAHAVGLIHRDIKPANVMACRRGGLPDVAKLLDFGLVQSADDAPSDVKLTRDGMVMGTPAFLSPEQASGRPTDARSDIYSLGCTAFFLLTGRAPFEKETVADVIAAHLLEPPPDPRVTRPDVPADLADVVQRCLAKRPADRHGTVRELEVALLACGCAGAWSEEQGEAWWLAHGISKSLV